MKIDNYKLKSMMLKYQVKKRRQKNMYLYLKDKINLTLHYGCLKHHSLKKDYSIAKLVGITENSVTSIRNKSYWNYNNLNPKDPVAMNLFTQKDLILARKG